MRLVRRAAVTAAATFTAATLAVTTPLSASGSSVDEPAWVPVLVAGAPVTDDPGDAMLPAVDVVGDAEHPAAYVRSQPDLGWGADGTISFRLRLDGNPLKSDTVDAGHWVAQLSTNEDPNAYDVAVVVNGGGAQQMTVAYNTDRQCCPGDFPEESFDGELVLDANVFVSAADTSFSGTPDYFLDWKTGLNGPLGNLPGADGPVRLLLGTSLQSYGTFGPGDIAGSSDVASASWEFSGSDLYGRSPVDGNLVRETTPPTVAFGPMASFALDRAPVTWSGSDPDTGISDYDLNQRLARWNKGLGAESAVLTGSELTESQQTMPRGATACYTVRARNGAHLTSEWAGPQCVARPLDQGFLTASTGWKTVTGPSYWGQSARLAKRRGATLSLAGVEAKRLAVVATTCPSCGKVKVVLGGKARGTVDLRSATTEHRQVLELPPFARKTGRLQLEVVSSGKPVRVDGVGISAG